jgi:hypothetical protein
VQLFKQAHPVCSILVPGFASGQIRRSSPTVENARGFNRWHKLKQNADVAFGYLNSDIVMAATRDRALLAALSRGKAVPHWN